MIAAHVATCTGWSWAQIEEELDLPMLIALNKYWRSHPPAHLLMAAYVGFKAPAEAREHVNDPAEVEAFLRMFRVAPPPPKADKHD